MHEHEQHRADENPEVQPAAVDPQVEAQPSDPGVGDEVMQILGDVERQFDRLRGLRDRHDQQLATLSEQSEELHRRENELEVRLTAANAQESEILTARAELEAEREAIEAERRHVDESMRETREALAAEREALEAERQDVQSQASQRDLALDDREMAIMEMDEELSGKERELQAMRDAIDAERQGQEQRLAERSAEIQNRADELELARAEFASEQDRVARLEEEIAVERERLEGQSISFAEREQEMRLRVEQAEENVGRLMGELESSQDALQALRDEVTRVEQVRTALEDERNTMRGEHESMAAQASAIEGERDELAQRMHAMEQARSDAESERAALSSRAVEAEGECDVLRVDRDELAQCVETLKRDNAAATAETEAVGDRAIELELERDEARDEAAKLQEQVAKTALDCEALQATIDRQAGQIARDQQKLEMAASKLSEFALALQEQTPQLERGAAALATVQEQHETIRRLRSELSDYKNASESDLLSNREERIFELERELNVLRHDAEAALAEADAQRASLERALSDRGEASSDEVNELRSQIAQLKRVADEARAAAAAAESASAASAERIAELESELELAQSEATDRSGDDAALQAQSHRIRAVAQHLARRRQRLQRLRRLIGQRASKAAVPQVTRSSTEDLEARAAQVRQLELQRLQLSEIKRVLTDSEKKMLRRWARGRSVGIVGWMTILAIFTAVGSWFAADHFFPATMVAVVELEPRAEDRKPLSEAELEGWKKWHAELPSDPSFHETLARRMAERHIDEYSSSSAVKQMIDTGLRVDLSNPVTVMFSYAGKGADEAQMLMDLMAATMVAESHRKADRRQSSATAEVSNERQVNGRLQFASIQPTPIQDERLIYGGIIFGATFGAILLLILVVYGRLARAKRVFDEDIVEITLEPFV